VRFLADESCDHLVVRTLRATGHDVLVVSELRQRSVNRELMELAKTENRVLLTEDKDFGWLAFAAHVESAGVVLIRFPAPARRILAASMLGLELVNKHGAHLENSFVVLQPGSIRISQRPG
jgi:predicted nuclease of predicted toxin-antitoxin system